MKILTPAVIIVQVNSFFKITNVVFNFLYFPHHPKPRLRSNIDKEIVANELVAEAHLAER